MSELEVIKQNIIHNKPYLEKEYGVKEIGIFGSVTRGEAKDDSDLDVLVELDHESVPIGAFKFFDLQDFLSSIVKRKVDLTTRNSIRPAFREYILPSVIYL